MTNKTHLLLIRLLLHRLLHHTMVMTNWLLHTQDPSFSASTIQSQEVLHSQKMKSSSSQKLPKGPTGEKSTRGQRGHSSVKGNVGNGIDPYKQLNVTLRKTKGIIREVTCLILTGKSLLFQPQPLLTLHNAAYESWIQALSTVT